MPETLRDRLRWAKALFAGEPHCPPTPRGLFCAKCGGPGSGKPGPCPSGEGGRPTKPPEKPTRKPKPQKPAPGRKPSATGGNRLAAALEGLPECPRKAAERATIALLRKVAGKYGSDKAKRLAAAARASAGTPKTVGELLALDGLSAFAGQADGKDAQKGTRLFALLASALSSAAICPADRPALEKAVRSLGKPAKAVAAVARLKTDDRQGHHHAPAGSPQGGEFTSGDQGGGGADKKPAGRKPGNESPSPSRRAAAYARDEARSRQAAADAAAAENRIHRREVVRLERPSGGDWDDEHRLAVESDVVGVLGGGGRRAVVLSYRTDRLARPEGGHLELTATQFYAGGEHRGNVYIEGGKIFVDAGFANAARRLPILPDEPPEVRRAKIAKVLRVKLKPPAEAAKGPSSLRTLLAPLAARLKARDASGHEHLPAGSPEGGEFTGSGGGGSGGKKPGKRKPRPAGEGTAPAEKPRGADEPTVKPGKTPDGNDTASAPAAAGKQRAFKGRGDAKKSLRSSKAKSIAPLDAGVNESQKIETEDGTLLVFKPSSGEGYVYPGQEAKGRQGVRMGVPQGTFYRREVAASRVAEALGFDDLVPPTTFRSEGKSRGSAQAFVDNMLTAKRMADPYDGDEDLAKLAAFDYLMGNTDRHVNNWGLVGGSKLMAYDHGLTLPEAIHPEDFTDGRMLPMWKAAERGLGMPDLGDADWGRVQKALLGSGISQEAVKLARQRFDSLKEAHKAGKSFGDLPDHFGKDGTLGERFGLGRKLPDGKQPVQAVQEATVKL